MKLVVAPVPKSSAKKHRYVSVPALIRGVPDHKMDNVKGLHETENISQVEFDSLKKVFHWMDARKDARLDGQEIADVRNGKASKAAFLVVTDIGLLKQAKVCMLRSSEAHVAKAASTSRRWDQVNFPS